jgi:hypothetical protein
MNAIEKNELQDSIARNRQHLADCRDRRDRRPTPYLRQLMQAWAGTPEIDFDYVQTIIEYELEEDEDNLARPFPDRLFVIYPVTTTT